MGSLKIRRAANCANSPHTTAEGYALHKNLKVLPIRAKIGRKLDMPFTICYALSESGHKNRDRAPGFLLTGTTIMSNQ